MATPVLVLPFGYPVITDDRPANVGILMTRRYGFSSVELSTIIILTRGGVNH